MKESTRKYLLKLFNRLDRYNILNLLSDRAYLKIAFRLKLNKKLDLKNPKTFNEKLQWIKLYDRNPQYTKMVDKYSAKAYIAEKIGEKYVIPVLGVWDTFDEVDFDTLPEAFVLKCTHDSGGLVICRNKSNLDKEAARKRIEKSLKSNYFWCGREWPYKNVKPRIIAEKYMQDSTVSEEGLTDYKFFCFGGVPKIMYISRDKSQDPRTDFFDMNCNHLDIHMRDPNADIPPEIPSCFEEMKLISEKLSEGIPHARIDFYVVENRPYVGEITFFHCGGFAAINPESWNITMGDWITLPSRNV